MGVAIRREQNLVLEDGLTRINVGDLIDFIVANAGVDPAEPAKPIPSPADIANEVAAQVADLKEQIEASVEAKLTAALAGHGPQPDPTPPTDGTPPAGFGS